MAQRCTSAVLCRSRSWGRRARYRSLAGHRWARIGLDHGAQEGLKNGEINRGEYMYHRMESCISAGLVPGFSLLVCFHFISRSKDPEVKGGQVLGVLWPWWGV